MIRDDRPLPPRDILIALAALYRATEQAQASCAAPSLGMRALLGLLHARSSGDRQPYDKFWHVLYVEEFEDLAGASYQRSTTARTAWFNIVRTLGEEPQSSNLHAAIRRTIGGRAFDEAAAKLAARVDDAKYDRDFISTKGGPHSERARQLMAARIARGEDPA